MSRAPTNRPTDPTARAERPPRRGRTTRAGAAAAALLCLATANAARSAPAYTLLDLGSLGGNFSKMDDASAALNSKGQVIGISRTASDPWDHGFRTAPNAPITAASDV